MSSERGLTFPIFKLMLKNENSRLTTHHSKAQRHEFRPSVVAMAERILITVWMISFQVSLFFIILKRPPLPPLGHLPLYGENSC